MSRSWRPSPAMTVALLALFVALGGTSYAVSVLPANSVGTTQIRDNSVTRAKLAHESITSVLVKDGSLTTADFAAGQLPAGPAGPTGPAGPAGPQGPRGETGATGTLTPLVLHTETATVAAGTAKTVQVMCKSLEHAVSGGSAWSTDAAGLVTVSLKPMFADAHGIRGYAARGENTTAVAQTFTAYALCYRG